METTKTNKMDQALDTLNYYKKITKKNKYFSKKFTDLSINTDGNVEIKRDWYEVNKLCVIEISKKHGIFNETKYHGITDDDTLADWLYQYDGDLGRIQKDYPEMDIYDIQAIFTWATMCMQRASSPMSNDFTNTQIHFYNCEPIETKE